MHIKNGIKAVVAIVAICCFFSGFSQKEMQEIEVYKKIYRVADSLNKAGIIYHPDSAIMQEAKSLDKEHPFKYFEATGQLFGESKFNEASFIFYTGLLRYRYYNAVNPAYEPSSDGALLASLQSVMGEPISYFLKTNIDNFISVLAAADEYCRNNDYVFYPENKTSGKDSTFITGYKNLIADLKTNYAKYRKEWDEERIVMVNNIDKIIDEYNKLTPKQKEELKDNN